jgi:hypothetical protein
MQNPPEDSPLAKTEEGKRYYNVYTGYMNRFEPVKEISAESHIPRQSRGMCDS